MIRTLWVFVNLFFATFGCASVAVAWGTFRPSPEFYNLVAQTWARWILWASAVRIRLVGLENLSLEQPQIIVANHVSWYDVFALAATLPKRFRFIAKMELARIPVFGRAWQVAGHIGVDRKDHQAAVAALDAAAAAMREDHSVVVIFAEGTRSGSDDMLPFKKGAFMMSLRTGVDIIPTAIIGSRRVLPKGGWRVRSGEIIVRFGPPVPPSDYAVERRDEFVQRVRNDIAAMIAAPVPPSE